MGLTGHAKKRMQPRLIDGDAIRLVVAYGRKFHARGAVFYVVGLLASTVLASLVAVGCSKDAATADEELRARQSQPNQSTTKETTSSQAVPVQSSATNARPAPSHAPLQDNKQDKKPVPADPVQKLSLALDQLDTDVHKLHRDIQAAAPEPQKPVLEHMSALYSTGQLISQLRDWLTANYESIDKTRAASFQGRLADLENRWQQLRIDLGALGRRKLQNNSVQNNSVKEGGAHHD